MPPGPVAGADCRGRGRGDAGSCPQTCVKYGANQAISYLSRKPPLTEPAARDLAAMRLKEPESLAAGGDDLPVIAQSAAPGGVVEPPFRGDAFGADGGGDAMFAPAPVKGGAGAGGVQHAQGFGSPYQQRAGMLGRGPGAGGWLGPGGGEGGGGFLGNAALGGVAAGDRIEPDAPAQPGDEVIERRLRALPGLRVMLGAAQLAGGDGFCHPCLEPHHVDAEARVEPV